MDHHLRHGRHLRGRRPGPVLHFEGKESGKKKQHGQFEIKAVKWDESVGGEDMDMILLEHFLAEFDAKHKPSVLSLIHI